MQKPAGQSAAGNREILQSIYREVSNGDLSFIEQRVAADCIVHEAASLPYGGSYKGPQGFIDVLTRIGSTWEGFRFEPHEYIAEGDYVAVLLTASGTSRKTGRSFTMPIAEFWRFANGKIVEFRPFYWDTQELQSINS